MAGQGLLVCCLTARVGPLLQGESTRVLTGQGSCPLSTAEPGPGEGPDLLHKADSILIPPGSVLISEVLSPEYYSLL